MASRPPSDHRPSSVPLDAARLAAAHALIEREAVPAAAPGAVLAVARRAGPASVRGFGLARWDPEETPAGPDTVYALASITKPFVAVAAVQLAERGRLRLDDPVIRHIPEFAAVGGPAKAAVTVRHLLAHTAGLDDRALYDRLRAEPERERRWETLAQSACAAPLLFTPGTRFRYSSTNATVLAEVVGRCAGVRFDAYLQEYVFAPLGMAATGFFPHEDASLRRRVAQVARSRWPEDRTPRDTIHVLFPPAVRVPRPGGGLFSSARDLVAFGRVCLDVLRGEPPVGASLTRAGLAAMLEPQTAGLPSHDPGKADTSARGLGWELPGLFAADRGGGDWSPSTFGHKGSSGTGLRIDPEQDLVVVFLTSRSGSLGPSRLKERVLHAAAAAGRSG